MKRIALISLLALSACSAEPMETTSTTNPEVPVSLLFEKDGCKVYRFYDTRTHYFVKCENSSSDSTISTEHCGKGCVRDSEINTSYEP